MANIFTDWNQYIDAFITIYKDNNLNNLYDLYLHYYDEIINKKSNIDTYIIEHFLKLNTHNVLNNLLIYNGDFPLYHYHQYNLRKSNDNLLSYEQIIDNYYNSYQKIYNILHKCSMYNQNMLINILYNFIPNINNHNVINDLNNDLNDDFFNEDINNCKIMAFYIDILNKHYTIDVSMFKDIPAISYDNINNRYLYINKSFSYIILSNIKFYSHHLQNIDISNNIVGNLSSYNNIVGGNLIFNKWDEFYYMFSYNKNGCDLDYDIIKNKTNEFYISFYHIIKNILQENFIDDKTKFQDFVQEGFDKFIYNVCHYTDTMILHGDIINLDADDLYINYKNIIKLFKQYDNSLTPNLEPLFEKVYNNVDDDSFLITIENNENLIDDFYINENMTIYKQRAILLDCIIDIYKTDIKKSQNLDISKLLNIVSEPFEIIDLNDIIQDYYVYNIYKELFLYENWFDIEAKENPNISATYKKLRYMRLKYYSNYLKQFYGNPNDD
jgi:hypothetical protein